MYALPPLWLLARWEDRRLGRRSRSLQRTAWVAGAFFAVDLILWHHAIEAVGAGLSTVLGNMQVVLVGLLAWALLGEKPARSSLAAIPIAMVGVVLISGAFEADAYGENPALGTLFGILTAFAYSGFLLMLRSGSGELRRVAGPLFDATLASAALTAGGGIALGELDLMPSVSAHAWLIALALSAQVLGWLLITVSLPRLPAVVTSILLTLQPVGTVVFSAFLLDERPTALQLIGTAAILAGLLIASAGRRPKRAPRTSPAYEVGASS